MRRMLTLLLVFLTIFFLSLNSVTMGIDKPGAKKKKTGVRSIYDPPAPLPPEYPGSIPTSSSQGKFYPFVGNILSPGDSVALTYYDYQKNSSMGRQIAFDGDGGKHFSWTNLIGPGDPDYNRFVDYNYLDSFGIWLVQGGLSVTPAVARAGFSNIELLSDNREILAYHHTRVVFPDTVPTNAMLAIEEYFSGLGEFVTYDIPDSFPGVEKNGIWPYVAVDSSDRIHIISHEGESDPGIHVFGYTRCYEDAESLKCEAPGIAEVNIPPEASQFPSNKVAPVDSTGTISHIIIASPVSNKVAIIYTKYIDPQFYQINSVRLTD